MGFAQLMRLISFYYSRNLPHTQESTGTWSTSCAPSARSRSWGTSTTSGRGSPTVRPTTISSSETSATSATRSGLKKDYNWSYLKFLLSFLIFHGTLMMFSRWSRPLFIAGHRRRRLHGAEQSVVRQPLCLLLLRPEDDRQDQVLRGRPQARLQEVLRQVSKMDDDSEILFYIELELFWYNVG